MITVYTHRECLKEVMASMVSDFGDRIEINYILAKTPVMCLCSVDKKEAEIEDIRKLDCTCKGYAGYHLKSCARYPLNKIDGPIPEFFKEKDK